MNGLNSDKKYTVLVFDGHRDGYAPEQCDRTCTVKELIEHLSMYDEDTLVFVSNDSGWTYGSIDVDTFELKTFNEDEEEDDE